MSAFRLFKKSTPPPVCDERLTHLAFIMDGNGRWAQKRHLNRNFGHVKGAENFRRVLRICGTLGVRVVTVYAFSTENWKRPKEEVDGIFRLLHRYMDEARTTLAKEQVRVVFIGDLSVLPPELKAKASKLEQASAGYERVVQIALNYGGRAEIVHAVNRLIERGARKVTEADIAAHLYTAPFPNPDLIIRTGGDFRTSNFLLWQSAYAEYCFTKTLWPDLGEREIYQAVTDFYKRRRRFGGL
ncbi:MAG: polyprenyl diphosphate synthase [Eubacteriales bacterium]